MPSRRDVLTGFVGACGVAFGAPLINRGRHRGGCPTRTALHAVQIGGAVDPQERLILIGQKRVPGGKELQALRMGIWPAGALSACST
jgi:hypothetical protein